ncbi:hypothetical protein CLPUN_51360 [Clostridium puniceum]|uniref:Chromosome partition protein Smc n=1 Tax=Clostridium puniceum TaxID=29367 RepID=A0A1S8SZP8_9CLOT|nr:hypothetical protein [Clostridium puniceum]OOM70872.1 hypothetical protein CLPUN_51360 [Clostridium puniceum]
MEDKSILIQSDEVTKNIMNEIQEDMINSLLKVSRNMSEDVIERLRPIEKKINDLKGNFQQFQEEEFEEKIEELNSSILKIPKFIEGSIEGAINNIVKEQNKSLFQAIEERLAILGLKIVKDAINTKEAILNKIDDINLNKIEEKVDIIERAVEEKAAVLEKSIEDNNDNSKAILNKVRSINDKIEDKDAMIELINNMQEELSIKMEIIQEEVEWGNKSFFVRLFGKRR